jgi:hypothetical protein
VGTIQDLHRLRQRHAGVFDHEPHAAYEFSRSLVLPDLHHAGDFSQSFQTRPQAARISSEIRLSLATLVAIPVAVVAKVLVKELWSRRLEEGTRAPKRPG